MRYFNDSDCISRKKIILEEYNIETASFSPYTPSVFLSHSSKDEQKLPYVIEFLENYGVKVYIDKNDPRLPKVTSSETARMLKENIKKCKKFILLVSENSKDSRWIPWELGLADISKTTSNVALLPMANDYFQATWTKQEYLGLYDRISKGCHKSYTNEIWMVHDYINNTVVELGEWLKRS